MSQATLTINSRNYGAWSLRGWLLCKFAGLDFTVEVVDSNDPDARAELLLLSPSFLVPRLRHDELVIWDTLAIGEYLNEYAGRIPAPGRPQGEGMVPLGVGRSPLGLRQPALGAPDEHQVLAPGFPVWAGAQADIDRIETLWNDCLAASGGPFLFGARRTMADAMYAPVCTRLQCYDVKTGAVATDYVETILALPEMIEWIEAARLEPDDVEELEMEF